MKVSNYFKMKECIVSNDAITFGINNELPKEMLGKIVYIASRLDTIRQHLKVPMIVNSWYRCPELNKLVHGSINSQHTKGEAVDFTPKMDLRLAYNIIIKSGLSFDQLIIYPKKNFIHISFLSDINKERKQILEL